MSHTVGFIVLLLYVCYSPIKVQSTVFSCNSADPCGCSQNDAVISSRIVGGEPVANRSWSWITSLRNSLDDHICGATILSRYYLLTAAHCVDNDLATSPSIKIAIGTDSLKDGDLRRVSQIYLHPKWNATTKTFEHDIAVLRLTTPISMSDGNFAKICLPDVVRPAQAEYPVTNIPLVAIGWGDTMWGGSLSEDLRQVTLITVDKEESKCQDIIKNVAIQFCAAVDGGGKDTCQGDSGGPLMHFSEVYRRWVLAGVTSSGYQCALPDYAGIYTRVSMYVDWIKSIVGDDGLVTVKENNANVNSLSNKIVIGLLSFLLFFLRHSL